jgi:hypothetical protein
VHSPFLLPLPFTTEGKMELFILKTALLNLSTAENCFTKPIKPINSKKQNCFTKPINSKKKLL